MSQVISYLHKRVSISIEETCSFYDTGLTKRDYNVKAKKVSNTGSPKRFETHGQVQATLLQHTSSVLQLTLLLYSTLSPFF